MSGICCKIRNILRSLPLAGAGLLLVFVVLLRPAFAATLSGNLSPPDGHAVSGATVQLLRQSNSRLVETKTGRDGQFFFADLQSGEYRLTAECSGFVPVTESIALSGGN